PKVRESEVDRVDAIAVAFKRCVDHIAVRPWSSECAMVHFDRKSRLLEVAIVSDHLEPEILDELKKAVHMIVGIDCGKLVGADIKVVKVAARRARRRLEVRGRYVDHFCESTLQRLRPSVGGI